MTVKHRFYFLLSITTYYGTENTLTATRGLAMERLFEFVAGEFGWDEEALGDIKKYSKSDAIKKHFEHTQQSNREQYYDIEALDLVTGPAVLNRYEVQHWSMCEGWENHWTVELHGETVKSTFETPQLAQLEIDDYFEDIQEQIDSGEREPDHGYDRSEYRVYDREKEEVVLVN